MSKYSKITVWHSFLFLYKCIPCFKGKTHRTNSRNGFESAFFRFLTFAKVAITYVTHFARSLVGVHFPNQIICLSDRHTKNSIGIVECFQFCSFRKNSQSWCEITVEFGSGFVLFFRMRGPQFLNETIDQNTNLTKSFACWIGIRKTRYTKNLIGIVECLHFF